MHHPSPMSSELGLLPAMYSFPGLINVTEMGINIGPANTCQHLQGVSPPNTSWERRCLRKHRRRADDEGCSAKKRRLMEEAGCDPLDDFRPKVFHNWPPGNSSPPLLESSSQALPQPCLGTQDLELPLSGSSSTMACPEAEGSCMEVEAAQRRLQEIEERITLEDDDDDDDDDDLDVEPAPRRPMLVMSDSLREGLQRGISDILPHTVAQSVSHSCMELVVWRPPEIALARRLKDSLQRQRKQQTNSRQPPSTSAPPSSLTPTNTPGETYSPLYCSPGAGAHNSGEEAMEL